MKKIAGRIAVLVGVIVFFVVLYTVVDATVSNTDVKFGYWVNKDTEDEYKNFVVLGTDFDETRTDLILFCQYSVSDNSLNVIQIPRDTRILTDRSNKKINSVYGRRNGIKYVKQEVESIVGIYPDNHIVLNFKGFKELVDALGGVEFNVPMRMYYTDPAQNLTIDLKPGKQVLNGEKAEMFMRFRQNNNGTGYADGDIGRLRAQRDFYRATVDKIVGFDGIVNIKSLMEVVGDNLKTDFTISDLFEHIDALRNIDPDAVNVYMLPGKGEYITENEGLVSYYIYDKEKTNDILNKYFKL